MLTVVTDDDARADAAAAGLDEIIRKGARRMLAAALEAEVAGYIEALAGELEADNHRQRRRISQLEVEVRELTETLDAARAMNRELPRCGRCALRP